MIYVFISYILTQTEHFYTQINSVKEKLRQYYKRGIEKGKLLRGQLVQYMTNLTLLRDQMRQYMTNLVQSKRTCKNSQSDFLSDNYQIELTPGQHALFKAVRNIIPKYLREPYRRVIYTLPKPTTQTIPTLEQIKGFLTVQIFLTDIKEKNKTGTKDIFNKNDDWTKNTFFKDIISKDDNPDHEDLPNWEIGCEAIIEIRRKQEKYKREMREQPPLIIPCQICRSQRHSARNCELYPFEAIAKECCSICLTEYKQEFFHIRQYCILDSRRTALNLIFEEMEETGYSHGRETHKTQ